MSIWFFLLIALAAVLVADAAVVVSKGREEHR